jgi:hypothetical protein
VGVRHAQIVFFLAIGFFASGARTASGQTTRSLLTKAIVAFGQGKLDEAKTALDRAEASTSEPSVLSKIHRQRGIILEVQDQALEAMIQFRKAIYYNPELKLSTREHKGRVSALFQCAQNFALAGIKEPTIRTKYSYTTKDGGVDCPVDTSGAIIVVPAPMPILEPAKPKITVNPAPIAKPPKSWFSSPTFWIITSLAVASSATAAGFYFAPPAGGDYGGSTGTTIRLPD